MSSARPVRAATSAAIAVGTPPGRRNALPLNQTDHGRARPRRQAAPSDTYSGESGRPVWSRVIIQAMVKATNGSADSIIPRGPPSDTDSW